MIRRSANRFLTLGIALCALVTSASFPSQQGLEDSGASSDAYVGLLTLLHGPSQVLRATSAACAVLDPDAANPLGSFEWLQDPGECEITYVPQLAQVVTPASVGTFHACLGAECNFSTLTVLVADLIKLAPTISSPLLRLEIQNLAWEMLSGIDKSPSTFRSDHDTAIDELRSEIIRLLKATLFSEADLSQLPSTLRNVSMAPTDDSIRRLVTRLITFPEKVFEVAYPSHIHAGMTNGRLFGRVFLTTKDDAVRVKLRDYFIQAPDISLDGYGLLPEPVASGEERYYELGKLFGTFPGFQAVLVIYFNVLDTELRLRPTEVVAGVRVYEVDGLITDSSTYSAVQKAISFRSVNYQRHLNWEPVVQPDYKHASPDSLEVRGLFDVNPEVGAEGFLVTTMQGNCLSCHAYSINALAPRLTTGRQAFTPAFFLAPERVLPIDFKAKIEESIAVWFTESRSAGT